MPSLIPFVRACGLGPLPELIEARAGERALLESFAREAVPIALRNAPATPMPISAMMGLFERGARLTGDRAFGLDVGEGMRHNAYGLWAEYCALGQTLGHALRRSVATSAAHSSGARLELGGQGEHWVWRFVIPPLEGSRIQHADHMLPAMLAFARQYLGPKWRPDFVEVSYKRDADAGVIEDRLQTPIRFGCRGTGIAFQPRDLSTRRGAKGLTRPAAARRLVSLRDVAADVILMDAPEPARSLSAIVALRLLDGSSDIEGAAHLAGMSVQTLQRRLREKGFTYREVVDAARRSRALSLVREGTHPLVEIALSLGYEDQANFTRAFIRWFGLPPSAMRRGR